MKKEKNDILRILYGILRVALVCETADGTLFSFYDTDEFSPVLQSPALRESLKSRSTAQDFPVLFQDEFHCFFACIREPEGFLYMGPMCHEKLEHYRTRQMFLKYGIDLAGLPALPAFSLPEISNMVLLACHTLRQSLPEGNLLEKNQIISEDLDILREDQVRFLMNEEEKNDDNAVRHSYHEEQLLLQAVREGRGEEAVKLAESMDRDSGRLSRLDIQHRRNMAIVGITLCSRAAIDGGLSPEEAYRLSGYYIQKCDSARDSSYMLQYRNQAILEFASRVNEKASSRSYGYIEQCKDYVRKHYREKIYLQEIADSLGISPTYLSRLFHQETGISLQDYINEERVYRASNLLLYSDLSLPEIAQYVHFPSQSYFGKQFKKKYSMTPKAYRSRYRTAEFTE